MLDFNFIYEFINEYKSFITLGFSVLIFILDLVILGIKNRQPLLTISSRIRELAPTVIKIAEDSNLKGEEKLSFAVTTLKGYLAKYYPKVSLDKYTKVIIDIIEEILTTPQKKGE